HDARAEVALLVAQLGKPRQQAVDQRAAPVAGRGMDHHAGGLVHDDHGWILEDDLEWDLVLGRQLPLSGCREYLDAIAGPEPLARLAWQRVETDRATSNQPLPLGPRLLGLAAVPQKERVEAIA